VDPPEPTRTATPSASADAQVSAQVSTAILTVPNLISFARILLMPVCAWLLASGRFGIGFALTGAVGASDFLDGWLARRTGSVSRLGQLLDPLADRLLIASVALALLVRGVIPWAAVALLLGRDLALLVGFRVLQRRGVRPPDVVWLGKAATCALLVALPALGVGETATAVAGWFRVLGLVLLWLGIALYYAVGGIYVRQALAQLRAIRTRTR
jgi:cardiolipin synthase (CMP-forming)